MLRNHPNRSMSERCHVRGLQSEITMTLVLIKFDSTALKAVSLNPNVYLRVVSNKRVHDDSV